MHNLENLLNLNGEIFLIDNGCWVKFEIKIIEKSLHVPHGIRYSLTLHDKHNRRVLGYDNAHSFKSNKKYGSKKETYDHIHKKMNIVPYEFESEGKLLEDFWESVEYYMENNR